MSRTNPNTIVSAVLMALVAGQGFAQYRVEITSVLHEDDPAPGLPGLTIGAVRTPQIDEAGNALFTVLLEGPGVNSTNDEALYHGQPGELQVIAREGEQAIGLPAGVVYSVLLSPDFSEAGKLSFASEIDGPGIVQGFNDAARWYGPPESPELFIQTGDPAPGTEPGTVFHWPSTFGALLNDQGDICIISMLSGPLVDGSNNKGVWVLAPGGELELVSREGMTAPGTLGGRFLSTTSDLKFNLSREVSFLGTLVIEGNVNHSNNYGIWAVRGGALTLVMREGDQAFGLPDGIVYAGNDGPSFNRFGDTTGSWGLAGAVTEENNRGAWIFANESNFLLLRKGDPVPGIGPDVFIDTLSAVFTNDRKETLYSVGYVGAGISDVNKWAAWFGPYDQSHQELRDGDQAPHFPAGTILGFVGGMLSTTVMNDNGDIVAASSISGGDVTPETAAVLWIRDRLRSDWFPLLRAGSKVGGRTVEADEADDLANYWERVNGSDGQRPSFNDSQQIVAELLFADGTEGVFIIKPLWNGDADADGDVDLEDYSWFQACFGETAALETPCEQLDTDENELIDLADAVSLVAGITGPKR